MDFIGVKEMLFFNGRWGCSMNIDSGTICNLQSTKNSAKWLHLPFASGNRSRNADSRVPVLESKSRLTLVGEAKSLASPGRRCTIFLIVGG